ncbi:MAG: class I SAM-dependent DNA methyltransferase [Bacillota bacterium]
MSWKAYNELAWIEGILAPPEKHEEEALTYVEAIKKRIPDRTINMLHLGCGAGGHDFHFKRYFSVTGVDISDGMLDLAKGKNPEITYTKGDMRTVDLGRKFDVVAIPDSIMYMTTLQDLEKAIKNAACHLKTGGILLVVAHMKEDFRANNFSYTGEKGSIHVTVFENNYIVDGSTYEAVFVCLIRDHGELRVCHEVHTLGLFSYSQWMAIFEECQLKIDQINMEHLYDQYLLEKGAYKLRLIFGNKRY